MILIWDNGEEYSHHCIHFVKFDETVFSEAEIVRCLPASRGKYHDPHVVGLAKDDALEWRSPNAYQQVCDLISPDWFLVRKLEQPDGIDEEHWDAGMVSRLLPQWRERPIHYSWGTSGYTHPKAWLDLLEARLKAEQ